MKEVKQKIKQFCIKPTEVYRSQNFIEVERTVSRPLRLPEVSLQPFDGHWRSRLSFWNTVKKIHDDNILDDHLNFVYLLQAITPKPIASHIVNSYPVSIENYRKVINHSKKRLGREDTLRQIYVLNLFLLVLCNNVSKRIIIFTRQFRNKTYMFRMSMSYWSQIRKHIFFISKIMLV